MTTTTTLPTVRRRDHWLALVAGVIAGLAGIAALEAGGALVAAHVSHPAAGGVSVTDTTTPSTPTDARVSDRLRNDGPGAIPTGTGDRAMFVGIARSPRVDPYPGGVALLLVGGLLAAAGIVAVHRRV